MLFKKLCVVVVCLLSGYGIFPHAVSAIAPEFEWVKNTNNVYYNSSCADSEGNLYFFGGFEGTNVNLNPDGTDIHSSISGYDSVLIKHNADGSYAWSKTWNGIAGYEVACDLQDNIYLISTFSNANVNFNPDGSDLHSTNGGEDIFLTKYTAEGTYIWTKTWGGTGNELGTSITFDSQNNVYISGRFRNNNVNFNPDGSDLHSSNGGTDAFVTKYNADGSYAWTKTWGGTGGDGGSSLAVDNENNLYVLGYISSLNVNFNSEGSDVHSTNGNNDITLTKYNADGTYGWTKTWGGTGADAGYSLAFDSQNNLYLTGSFQNSNVNFNPDGSDLHSSNGDYDIFLTKYNTDSSYAWTKTWGGIGYEDNYWSRVMRIDSSDRIHITGVFEGTVDFDPGSGVNERTAYTPGDYFTGAFITAFNTSGEHLWVRSFGGEAYNEGSSVVSVGNTLYVSGYISSPTNFNPDGEAVMFTPTGDYASFIVKYTYPQASVSSSSSSSQSPAGDSPFNPNCLSGWKYCIQFGANHHGSPSFLESYTDGYVAKVFIEPKAHHDDTFVRIAQAPIDSLTTIQPTIPFPWMQGYNLASPIWNVSVVSAFNGYPIPLLDNPGIILLAYDPLLIGSISPSNLRIGYFDPVTSRWNILLSNTVLNQQHHTLANTTKSFGYMAVLYQR